MDAPPQPALPESITHGPERYRLATRADIPAFAEMLADPEVGRWLWFTPISAEMLEGFFGPLIDRQESERAAGEHGGLAIFVVEDAEGRFLGQGAAIPVEMSPGGYEIGFQLTRGAWGRGVGTRLGRFLCAYALVRGEAHRIEGACLEGNVGSVALLRKLGLELEGRKPGYRVKEGARHAELLFGREVSELDTAALRALAAETGLA